MCESVSVRNVCVRSREVKNVIVRSVCVRENVTVRSVLLYHEHDKCEWYMYIYW